MFMLQLTEAGVSGLNGARVRSHVGARLLTGRGYATTRHQPMEVLAVMESILKQN